LTPLLAALRAAADGFFAAFEFEAFEFGAFEFEALEVLWLRVLWATTCAWNRHAPVQWLWGNPSVAIHAADTGSCFSNVAIIAHFPQKSMIYDRCATQQLWRMRPHSLIRVKVESFRRVRQRHRGRARLTPTATSNNQSPLPGFGEKNFSNLPSWPSNSLASSGWSFFWVMFGQLLA
jgi:hypothetical protein